MIRHGKTFIQHNRGAEAMGVSISGQQSWARDLEAVIGRVRAVVAARLVLDAEENVETIHVLATRARTAEQIVADIEAVCAAMFDLYIDRRRVRISQPDEPAPEARPVRTEMLALRSLSLQSAGDMCRVVVQLQAGDGLYEGEAHGADVTALRPRLSAEAALAAVAQFQEEHAGESVVAWDPFILALYELQRLSVGPGLGVVVSLVGYSRREGGAKTRGLVAVEASGPSPDARPPHPAADDGTHAVPPLNGQAVAAEQWLIGCALVQKDLPDAAVRAVLDAVNRYVFYHPGRRPLQ